MEDQGMGLRAAAEDILSAIEQKSPDRLNQALCNFYEIYEAQGEGEEGMESPDSYSDGGFVEDMDNIPSGRHTQGKIARYFGERY